MGKSKQENATDQQGTPVYIIISLVFAILLFAVEGLKNSIGLSSESELRLASLAFVAEGLALCFFWRRLHEGTWKTLNAIVFTAGLWVYLFLMILTPMLLPQKSYLVQQVGFWIVIASSFLLMLNILFDSKLIPSSMLTAVVGLLAGFASIWGFVSPPRSAYGEKLLSSSKNQHNSEEPDQQHDEEEMHSSAFAEDEHDEPEPNSKKATHRSEPEEDEETTPKEIDEPRIDSKKVRMKLAARAHEENDSSESANEDQAAEVEESHAPEPPKKSKRETRSSAPNKTPKSSRTEQANSETHEARGVQAQHKPHWEYAGAYGPAAWGNLSQDFRLCSKGREQSPIDIPESWALQSAVQLFYRPSTFDVIDNGHTVQYNVESGNYAVIQGKRYELKQIHFHTPSEHFVEGRSFILEAHFVHATAKGELAVLGSFIEAGPAHRGYQKLWDYMPYKKNETVRPRGVMFSPRELLPRDLAVYTYAGSLTTPPCTEKVNWNVLRETVQMSQEQINKFRAKYRMNARPVQPLENR
jgi:carbonic anhydrase